MDSFSASGAKAENCLLVYITLPIEADARAFCHALVEARLAAGMNILAQARSIYTWKDETCEADEWIIFAQVAGEAFEDFKKAALVLHPYVTPCVIAADISAGSTPFLQWINSYSRKRPI